MDSIEKSIRTAQELQGLVYKEKLDSILPPSKSSSKGEWKKPKDTRIVYGANCVWWDSIDKVGSTSNHPRYPEDFQRGRGLPCCPHCGSVLFEVPSEEEWYREVELFEKCDKNGNPHPGYKKFIEWQRGKCFPSMASAAAKYKEETGIEINFKF